MTENSSTNKRRYPMTLDRQTIEARRARQRAAMDDFTAAHTKHDVVLAEYDDVARPWDASCQTCGVQIRPDGVDESKEGGTR